jgi:small-conductance mechanosensitive channel
MVVKTSPSKHFEIGRELRRRIMLAFEREGINSPMTQQLLNMAKRGEGIKG